MKKTNSLKYMLLACFISMYMLKGQVTQTYTYTGALQSFTLPGCVSSISYTCYGAQGANGVSTASGSIGGTGGLGAGVSGVYTVTGNSVLNIYVGGAGSGSVAGFNGGGSGSIGNSGAGGGATDIRLGGTALGNRVVVAGGGGGGGNAGCPSATITGGNGGAGGGGNGTNGVNSLAGGGGQAGVGTVGGAQGIGCSFASGTVGVTGTAGQGGSGGAGPSVCIARVSGGGGGGGYFGGGGGGGGSAGTTSCTLNDQGGGGGGAGGTNYFATGSTGTFVSNGVRTGSGLVIISYSIDPTPVITANSGTVCSGKAFTITPGGASTYTFSGGLSVVSPTSDMSYTVTGTSSLGCTNSTGVESSVTVYATPNITVNSGSICQGNSFTMNPSGADTYTYAGGSPVVSPGTTTSYSVVGANVLGCISNTATSSVTVQAAPALAVNSGSICADGVFTMTPSGADTYTFSNGTATISPTSNTLINITGTSPEGCISIVPGVASITVEALPLITVNSGAICPGESFTITPGGADTYSITGGSTIVAPASDMSYTVTGTSAAGCVSSTGVVSSVTVHPDPVITVNSGTICSGESFTITPGGADTYSITGGSTVVAPTSDMSYTVTGTSAAGCIGSLAVVSSVTVHPNPVITVNSGSICSGDPFVMIPGGASSYTYAGGSATVMPLADISYSVTGTSSLGCVSESAAVSSVTVGATPTIVVNSGNLCAGEVFTMTPSGAASYTFSNGSSTISPVSNTVVNVTGTASNGCVSSAAAVSNITVTALPVVTINSGTMCSGNQFTLNPAGATSYTIQGGSNTVSPVTSASYSVIGSTSLGCISLPAVSNITVFSLPSLSIAVTPTDAVICTGDPLFMNVSGAASYTWNNTTNGSTYNDTPSASASYSVVGMDNNGCMNTAIQAFVVNPLPVVTVAATNTFICQANSATLTATGGSTYSWSTADNTSSVVVSPALSTVYNVTATSVFGCSKTETISVTVNTIVIVTGPNAVICDGGSANLFATGADSYTWLPVSSSVNSVAVTPSVTTTYTYSGTDVQQCLHTGTIMVTVNPNPVLTLNTTPFVMCSGETATITASGADTYTWSAPAGIMTSSVVISPVITTTYMVSGANTNGCTSEGSIALTVDACTGLDKTNNPLVKTRIYPNPNAGEFTVELHNYSAKTIDVLDISGRSVLTLQTESDTTALTIEHLANGIYYVKIQSNGYTDVIKVIKN